jgi:hypothetical protein
MKHIFLFILISVTLGVYGQEKKGEVIKTKADEFSEQSGRLVQKKFLPVAAFKNHEVEVLRVKDLKFGDSISSLRFKLAVHKSYGTVTKITAVDKDEVEGMIAAIRLIYSHVKDYTPATYEEIEFKSRTGVAIGAYYNSDKASWTGYIQIDKYESETLSTFKLMDFTELLLVLESALPMM